ncbi:MAG TPA: AMP-binding protein [Solirubrobacteraceae bacterium]|nr:AMP-binding protein [Solirubrobacteraceae bacterium]
MPPRSGKRRERLQAKLAMSQRRIRDELFYVRICFRQGMLGLEPPGRLLRIGRAFWDYGMLGGSITIAAIRHPNTVALIDERRQLTYRELEARTNAIANAWIARGLAPGDGVALLIRNHGGFLEALLAGAKCGARIILMNTGFSGPQIREVAEREGTDLLVYDQEYAAEVGDLPFRLGSYRAWTDDDHDAADTLESLATGTDPVPPPPKPARPPRLVILTSGTTGTPKGAGRDVPFSLAPVGGPLSKVPFRSGDVTQISAPMFHALGFSQALLQVGLGATLVLQRRFDERALLDSVERHRVTTLILVPVMLQRLVALDPAQLRSRDLSSLRIIYLSGSQLGTDLAQRATSAFGPVLYNLYGSTEITFATIATPEDLAAVPGTVGRVVRGAMVKVVDNAGNELPAGQTGRIFVGNIIHFEGYTGGADKERLRGMVSSGDVGHFDADGRLFIDGRDDEMIISGGENVFPAEIEELLCGHPAVLEAAAVGVQDAQFGQRLKVFVVARDGLELSEEEVKSYVRDNLARYKVPREVVFMSELPRNPTGKVVKRDLD